MFKPRALDLFQINKNRISKIHKLVLIMYLISVIMLNLFFNVIFFRISVRILLNNKGLS